MTFSRRSSSFVAISTVLPIVTTKSLLFLIVESESVGQIESVVSYSTLSLGADLGSSARAGGGAWRKLDVIRRWADSHVKH